MANFEPDRPGPGGGTLTWRNAAAGDSFTNDGYTLLLVKNTSGGAVTCTADDPNSQAPTSAQQFNPDVQRSVPVHTGSQCEALGPYAPNRFNDANGRVQLTWGSTPGATLQWAAVTAFRCGGR